VTEADFDAIVVGAGGAGLAAALAAAESGARVLVVESENRTGGSTRLSDAWLQAAGTSVQRRDGIEDSPAAMYAFYMALNRWQLEPGLTRAFCEDAPEVVEWLRAQGLGFLPTVHAASEPVPRGHRIAGEGEALVGALERACASRGDALALGESVGAALAGRDRAHWVPLPLVPPDVLLVTAEGRRFVDESADHSVRTAAAGHHGHTYYALFDEGVRRRGSADPFVRKTVSGQLFCDAPLATGAPPVRDWLAAGELALAATLGEAAAALGLPRAAVEGALEQYAAACAAGRDARFEKPARHLRPLGTPPCYALRIRPALLVATFCGLRIDADARVLDAAGRPIPGLFAAGECAGGAVGEVYAGHGNSITTGLVFGRRAGRGAAAFTRAHART
jgi:fumarate reductase flavoprotein subunit